MLKTSVATVWNLVVQDLFTHGLLANKHLDAIECGLFPY